jgi:serine protease Do
VAVDGKPVRNVNQLQNIIATHKPGDKVTLTILRDGEQKTVEVGLIERK